MATLHLRKKVYQPARIVAKSNTISSCVAIQARQRELGIKPTVLVAYVKEKKQGSL